MESKTPFELNIDNNIKGITEEDSIFALSDPKSIKYSLYSLLLILFNFL